MKLIYALFLFVLGGLVVYSCKQSNVHLTSQNTQLKLKPAEVLTAVEILLEHQKIRLIAGNKLEIIN